LGVIAFNASQQQAIEDVIGEEHIKARDFRRQ
jgi:hypothetical protein